MSESVCCLRRLNPKFIVNLHLKFHTNFSEKEKYLLELYRTLHPEDTEATEDTLTDVTIESVQ